MEAGVSDKQCKLFGRTPALTTYGIVEKERVGVAQTLSGEVGEVEGDADNKKHRKES